jgi:hypothetical protein
MQGARDRGVRRRQRGGGRADPRAERDDHGVPGRVGWPARRVAGARARSADRLAAVPDVQPGRAGRRAGGAGSGRAARPRAGVHADRRHAGVRARARRRAHRTGARAAGVRVRVRAGVRRVRAGAARAPRMGGVRRRARGDGLLHLDGDPDGRAVRGAADPAARHPHRPTRWEARGPADADALPVPLPEPAAAGPGRAAVGEHGGGAALDRAVLGGLPAGGRRQGRLGGDRRGGVPEAGLALERRAGVQRDRQGAVVEALRDRPGGAGRPGGAAGQQPVGHGVRSGLARRIGPRR